ncbi:hypothetical protein SmJEL517_g06282 [Synchytrium microbalum]|uniref:Uncharacterized protein n=1 Tax=Synchytrium microbalum TaxID=1806994 RepID=A0A507BW73_9FUNG|nr:uncharacterized protein SmJEL517_g06282 [Synchytrium microbalum]TPX30046.1 hypothetical protein SmJEL517_g06282 [Synchytrium microbalum]
MPLDILGRTRATLTETTRIPSKCESSARVDYVPALCTHRPSLLPIEWLSETSGLSYWCFTALVFREVGQTWSFRGSKSRNKVTVGEPAVGSLHITDWLCYFGNLQPNQNTM